MRMSCNGCRVLRKGCGDDCSIRPCLQWIKSPDSQAHATVFLAKFYGRAGLMNLINAGPEHLRPAIFRSLLYEACGRILNPIYGSVGLLWDGSWQLCHAAMEAVLSGVPITPIASAAAPPLKAYDIRHIPRQEDPAAAAAMMAAVGEANRARPIRSGRFKRPGARTKAQRHPAPPPPAVEWCDEESNRSPSHDSSLSHQSVLGAANAGVGFGGGDSKETESNSMVSAETTTTTVAEPPQPLKPEPEPESAAAAGAAEREDGASAEPESEVGLELTLGFKPASREDHVIPVKKRRFEQRDEACSMELGL